MDPLLPKRPCCGGDISASSLSAGASAPFPTAGLAGIPGCPEAVDRLMEEFLGISNSSSVAVDLSLERLVESRLCESEKSRVIESAMQLGLALVEAAKRSARKRATKHNSASWPLPPDLTIKVFSMLDTQSLCHAAAACSMFNKCAIDPLCYATIDLISIVPKVNNTVVSTMIQRAGKNLRSLKLGIWPSPSPTLSMDLSRASSYSIRSPIDASVLSWNEKRSRQGKESSILSRSCLLCLSMDGGAAGALLRKLHLYNIDKMDSAALCTALSACQSLVDLELIGLHVELSQILASVHSNCHLIERLFLESSKTGRDDSLKSPTCVDLVNCCPHLTSLALRGFKLHDHKVRILVKGFHKLKLVDFSTSYSITGTFLRNIGGGGTGNLLETLILRDCLHLKEVEVARFLSAVLAGDCKNLRVLDISNKDGLSADEDWYHRCYSPSTLPTSRILEERPEICLLAEFPTEGSFVDIDQMVDSEVNSDISMPSQTMSSQASDSLLMSSSESSYNSDQGSGNEDNHDATFATYEESSDEVDFLFAW